jgi:hypothetical protein
MLMHFNLSIKHGAEFCKICVLSAERQLETKLTYVQGPPRSAQRQQELPSDFHY